MVTVHLSFVAEHRTRLAAHLDPSATDGGVPARDQYFSDDVAATIYHKLSLPIDPILHAPDGRPIRMLEGQVIKEWV